MSIGQQLLDGLVHKAEPLETTAMLQDGDGLRSEDPEAVVQLECASGATQTLSGMFDVVLQIHADGKGCRSAVRGGQAVATTAADPNAMPDGNPEFQVGELTFGAGSTLFGVSVDRSSAEGFVIDGVVVVRKNNEALPALAAGHALSVDTLAVNTISDARYEYVASSYAKLDVATLPVEQQAARQTELKTVYVAAFKNPNDAQARTELTSRYSALPGAPNAARAYQVRKQASLSTQVINQGTQVVVPPPPPPPHNFHDHNVVQPQ